MGIDFLRGRREQDARRREQIFEEAVNRGDLFSVVDANTTRKVAGIAEVALEVGELLVGRLSRADQTLSRGKERALRIAFNVVDELRGSRRSIPVVAEVVAVDAETKVATVRIINNGPTDDEA